MAKVLTILILGLATSYAKYVYEYEQPLIKDETQLVVDLLRKPIIPERFKSDEFMKAWGIKSRLTSFSWNNCGGAAEMITEVTLTPDPLQFPGTVTAGFTGMINASIIAPLRGDVLMEKKVGSTYVKIPCISSVGSCVYEDLCAMLETVTCPDSLVKAGIDCRCPFKSGNYKLPPSSFEADLSNVPSGDYHLKGMASDAGKSMACLELYMSVA